MIDIAEDHANMFRRFVRACAVERKITIKQLERKAGISHTALGVARSPRYMGIVWIVSALREYRPFTDREKQQLLACFGAVDEVPIPEVNLAAASADLCRQAQIDRRAAERVGA